MMKQHTRLMKGLEKGIAAVRQSAPALLVGLAALASAAHADEAAIRKNLAQRLPNLPPIEEVAPSPIPGVYEIRVNGSEIFYTDENGNYFINGQIIDTKTQVDLTEARINKLTAIAFDQLPAKDSFTIVRGNGKRKIAIFEDPNCGYCKHFERDLAKVDNVTISLYLYPILGPDSVEKSRAIWCARDKGKVWQDWMLRETAIPSAPAATANAGACDTAALARNVEFGRKYRINGTPTMVFVNGDRVPGAVDYAQIEKMLADAGK